MTTPPGGRARITRERRRRPFVGGIIAAAVGVLVLVGGAMVLSANQAVQVLGAAARAEVPDPMSFDAEARRYAVVLLPHPLTEPGFDPVAELVCQIDRADGTSQTVRGADQAVELSASGGTSVGSFDAVAGPTTVSCNFSRGTDVSGLFVAVAPERTSVQLLGYVLVGLGLAIGAAGVGAIIIGIRGRTVVVPAPTGDTGGARPPS